MKGKFTLGSVLMLLFTLLVLLLGVLFWWKMTRPYEENLPEITFIPPVWSTIMPHDAQKETPIPREMKEPIGETPTPEPEPITLHIAATGTIYAPKAVRLSVKSGKKYQFEPVFEGLGDVLAEADLAIATLETMTAGAEQTMDYANTTPEILDALRECGLDLLSLATECALDQGEEGLELTRRELATRGLAVAGLTADRLTMVRVGGLDVAVLAYTYGVGQDGQGNPAPSSAVMRMDIGQMKDDIRQARTDGAQVVIVLPHWGMKNIGETPVSLRKMAQELAEAGADIILGAHPNIVQGTERLCVTRADGLSYETVVCYSLGSLLTDARTQENTAGMIAQIAVTVDPVSRRVQIGEVHAVPTYVAQIQQDGNTVYRVVSAENQTAVDALPKEEQEAVQKASEWVQAAMQKKEFP